MRVQITIGMFDRLTAWLESGRRIDATPRTKSPAVHQKFSCQSLPGAQRFYFRMAIPYHVAN